MTKENTAEAEQDERRWQAIVARSSDQDGRFVYAVTSTGVFCKPSCPSRQALRKNVRFYESPGAAIEAGFRACKRCSPQDDAGEAEGITRACRHIEQADSLPAVARLAAQADLTSSRFQRLFKQHTGLTPRQYATAVRERRVRGELQQGHGVTDALYRAGYGSSGRFYESADRVLGMQASRYRAGGEQMQIQFAVGQCALGAILVAESERGICAIYLGDDPDQLARDLQDQFRNADIRSGDDAFDRTVAAVVGYVETPGQGLALPLDIRGTAFQKRVWDALCTIPPGRTASYRDIAEKLGQPRSVRAVAGACAANKLAIAIPCHRVVRSDGALSGYRWGVERKRRLLGLESASAGGAAE